MPLFKRYLVESPTSDQARGLGLSYFGFGKYGKDGVLTHVVRFGRLVPVHRVSNIDTSGSKLKHLEHIEDEIFNRGIHGVRNSLNSMYAIRDYFKHKTSDIKLNQKVDGAPSTIISHEPGKKPYVSTKSAFNATPKLNFSHKDVEANHASEGLQEKMKAALDYLPKAVHGGTYQGDLLYTHHDIKVKNIDRVAHFVFKPNTITYAVPVNSKLGKRIAQSKIGIVIHTQYKDGKADFDPDFSKFKEHPDAVVLTNDMANSLIDITPEEEHEFNNLLSAAGRQFQSTEKEVFDLIDNSQFAKYFKTYINSKVREGKLSLSSKDFISYVSMILGKDIEKVKTEKNKAERTKIMRDTVYSIQHNSQEIEKLFRLHKALINTKDHLISVLNKHQMMKSFMENDEGELEPVDPEGYVITTDAGALKLVNRLGFSAANFNANKWNDK